MEPDTNLYVLIDDIVSSGEIAKMLSVTQPQLTNWKNRYEGFPAPFKVIGSKTSLYRRSEILAWYAAHFPERVAVARALASLLP